MVFVCKRSTAYELRISDWSSDVCSSDLRVVRRRAEFLGLLVRQAGAVVVADVPVQLDQGALVLEVDAGRTVVARLHPEACGDVHGLLDFLRRDKAVGHAIGLGSAT